MGFITDFDHWQVAEDLDFASWDSYPIGFVETFPFTEAERARWAETSHPDVAAFHHDLYRGIGRGRFWVMEQQPGPVNWAPWNPVPKPGMVRLWTWEALAHGADVVSYFRWRQAPFAQEQLHAGLNLPGLDTLSPGGREVETMARELEAFDLPPTTRAPVAIVFDYPSVWGRSSSRKAGIGDSANSFSAGMRRRAGSVSTSISSVRALPLRDTRWCSSPV